jgi:hypothetical protein
MFCLLKNNKPRAQKKSKKNAAFPKKKNETARIFAPPGLAASRPAGLRRSPPRDIQAEARPQARIQIPKSQRGKETLAAGNPRQGDKAALPGMRERMVVGLPVKVFRRIKRRSGRRPPKKPGGPQPDGIYSTEP